MGELNKIVITDEIGLCVFRLIDYSGIKVK